jgi:hypothetical protein
MSNFITNCINGDALLSEIDDYISLWHHSDSILPLHDFLGMTRKEYALYLEDDRYLASIVTARLEGVPIRNIIQNHLAMVARSDNHEKSAALKKWLKNEGLWD